MRMTVFQCFPEFLYLSHAYISLWERTQIEIITYFYLGESLLIWLLLFSRTDVFHLVDVIHYLKTGTKSHFSFISNFQVLSIRPLTYLSPDSVIFIPESGRVLEIMTEKVLKATSDIYTNVMDLSIL